MDDESIRLNQARVRTGLGLRAAAELLEITPKELADRENGRSNPDPEEWERMFHRLAMASDTGRA